LLKTYPQVPVIFRAIYYALLSMCYIIYSEYPKKHSTRISWKPITSLNQEKRYQTRFSESTAIHYVPNSRTVSVCIAAPLNK